MFSEELTISLNWGSSGSVPPLLTSWIQRPMVATVDDKATILGFGNPKPPSRHGRCRRGEVIVFHAVVRAKFCMKFSVIEEVRRMKSVIGREESCDVW